MRRCSFQHLLSTDCRCRWCTRFPLWYCTSQSECRHFSSSQLSWGFSCRGSQLLKTQTREALKIPEPGASPSTKMFSIRWVSCLRENRLAYLRTPKDTCSLSPVIWLILYEWSLHFCWTQKWDFFWPPTCHRTNWLAVSSHLPTTESKHLHPWNHKKNSKKRETTHCLKWSFSPEIRCCFDKCGPFWLA